MIRLVVFLGNAGPIYAGNRHNVAWQFAESLEVLRDAHWQRKFRGLYACVGDVYYLKPHTFMNLSGESAGELARFYKIEPAQILVVHDELELPLAAMSAKWAGGLGGHNGLRSIEACLGTRDFWRLRFGIGRPPHDDVAGYVLSDFLPEERDALGVIFSAAASLFCNLLSAEPVATGRVTIEL
ncbi:MAG: aminoacyl-tRNA hydrolase [Spirochaetaceae bacterium]|jgi:PTH1 family peptidyl-tRNA hydrolase|nr:aminoacyl-tRNA hydrolase [Spirochaetaceae bacterium]